MEAVARAGSVVLVGPDTTGHDGDMVYVLVHRNALEELDDKLARDGGVVKVAVAGAGNVGDTSPRS